MQTNNNIYNILPTGLPHPNNSRLNYPPAAPDDPELKNIIDKLASFVSRNGIEFENVTKEKQQDNPKFSFLFGGAHYNYYQFRLSTEREQSSFILMLCYSLLTEVGFQESSYINL